MKTMMKTSTTTRTTIHTSFVADDYLNEPQSIP